LLRNSQPMKFTKQWGYAFWPPRWENQTGGGIQDELQPVLQLAGDTSENRVAVVHLADNQCTNQGQQFFKRTSWKITSWVVQHYPKANTTRLTAAILKIDMMSYFRGDVPIWTKFGNRMQNNMQITAKWSRLKPEAEFNMAYLFQNRK